MHHTVTAANSGLSRYAGATFTAALGGVLDDASYDNDAAATAGAAPVFTSPSLTWTGDVPAGGTVTITYSVTINRPDTGNGILASAITSTSAGGNCPVSGSADPRCTATVDVAAMNITATLEHPGFGGDSILPRCSGLGGRCLPRYRRLAEPRSDHFPLLFYRTSVQLRCPAAPPGGGLCPPGPRRGLGHLLVGHPLLRRGFPGRGKGDAQRHRLRRRRRP